MNPEDEKAGGESRAQLLIARYLDEMLSKPEAAELLKLCGDDKEILRELSELSRNARLLPLALESDRSDLLPKEIKLRLSPDANARKRPPIIVGKIRMRLRMQRIRGIAAALTLAALGAWWLSPRNAAAARVMRTEALKSDSPISKGYDLRPQQTITIRSGFAEIRFGCGAEVILEGPAELELRDSWRATLKRGRAVARVPERARGFTLDGPCGSLVDRGTQFGVSVGESGDMELHVLEGAVDATANGSAFAERVTTNEALRLSAGRNERLASADQASFVTTLPPRHTGTPGFIHWSFDDAGPDIFNRGRKLGGPNPRIADLKLRPHQQLGSLPSTTSGVFGNALHFDGNGGFAESAFRGIGGSAARTVAFWIKVPSDFNLAHGFAAVSWGSKAESGSAWQVSVNPTESEGPIGRLRIGVNQGPVVGTTDLRDDQWHHCAVVMYGGQKANTSTNILLYVDGELEQAARKAVMQIRTDTEDPRSPGVCLGRNLHPSSRQSITGFRGSVDEVYIFDAALGQSEIRRLISDNSPSP